jgi:hypothetical protein
MEGGALQPDAHLIFFTPDQDLHLIADDRFTPCLHLPYA